MQSVNAHKDSLFLEEAQECANQASRTADVLATLDTLSEQLPEKFNTATLSIE